MNDIKQKLTIEVPEGIDEVVLEYADGTSDEFDVPADGDDEEDSDD